jgi:hypothetical protein
MNAIFGHGGWSSQIITERLVVRSFLYLMYKYLLSTSIPTTVPQILFLAIGKG